MTSCKCSAFSKKACRDRRIYVHQMKQPRLAEAYCDRMYEAAAKQKGQRIGNQMAAWSGLAEQHNYDMYLALIQVDSRAVPCRELPRYDSVMHALVGTLLIMCML